MPFDGLNVGWWWLVVLLVVGVVALDSCQLPREMAYSHSTANARPLPLSSRAMRCGAALRLARGGGLE